jgi:glucose-6-phosphate 1-dehydrogenase
METVNPKKPKDATIFTIFGASGDLTKRLLMPAIFNLFVHDALPDKFFILGLSNAEYNDDSFREYIKDQLKEFGTQEFDEEKFEAFRNKIFYSKSDFDDPHCYQTLKEMIDKIDKENQIRAKLIFYLAISPSIFKMVSNHLGESGFSKMEGRNAKLILEKPFGRDLKTALDLNQSLHNHWEENQVWRIDHYLGKETVQNLLAFRFGNGIFEPLWNRNYIDHVQITVGEEVGVEKRGSYYDHAGALRDMVQNHLFQVLSYVAMEAPNSFEAETIRNAKVAVMQAITPFSHSRVISDTVRGQYGAGKINNREVIGYRQEPDVDPHSTTETFAALKLSIDNWRWAGVPFYLRTGKRLARRYAEVTINFKRAPKKLFQLAPTNETVSNELRFFLQPHQGIELLLKAKVPGRRMTLQPVKMDFDYEEAFHTSKGTGYEVLIYDCLFDDPMLFSRADLIEKNWKTAQPILDVWSSLPPDTFPNYEAGSWGPKEASALIERDGRKWRVL